MWELHLQYYSSVPVSTKLRNWIWGVPIEHMKMYHNVIFHGCLAAIQIIAAICPPFLGLFLSSMRKALKSFLAPHLLLNLCIFVIAFFTTFDIKWKRAIYQTLPFCSFFFKKFLLIWILSEKWKWKVPFLSEVWSKHVQLVDRFAVLSNILA